MGTKGSGEGERVVIVVYKSVDGRERIWCWREGEWGKGKRARPKPARAEFQVQGIAKGQG